MIGFNYNEIRSTVKSLLEEFGKNITFFKKKDTPQVHGEPWEGASGVESVSTKSVSLPPSSGLGWIESSDELLERTKAILISAPLDKGNLEEYTEAELGGTHYRIIDMQTLKPVDLALLHYVWLER